MLAAMDSCFGLFGPRQGFSTGLVPLTREAIVPYLVAVSLSARLCNTVIQLFYSSELRSKFRIRCHIQCILRSQLCSEIFKNQI